MNGWSLLLDNLFYQVISCMNTAYRNHPWRLNNFFYQVLEMISKQNTAYCNYDYKFHVFLRKSFTSKS